MSSNAIHTFAQLGRYGVLDKLGVSKKQINPVISDPLIDNTNIIFSGKWYIINVKSINLSDCIHFVLMFWK